MVLALNIDWDVSVMEAGSLFRSDWAVSAWADEPSSRSVTRPADVFRPNF